MFCIGCGQELNDDAKFCSKCGTQQKKTENESIEADKPELSIPASFYIPVEVDDIIEKTAAVISQNGKYLAIKTKEDKLQIIDTQSGVIIDSTEIDTIINICNINTTLQFNEFKLYAVCNYGYYIVIYADSSYFLINLKRNKSIILDSACTSSFAFNNDCTRLAYIVNINPASGKDKLYFLKIWNIQNDIQLMSIKSDTLILTFVYSPDGRYILTVNYSENTIKFILWDARGGEELKTLIELHNDQCEGVHSIIFSHNSEHIAMVLFNRELRIWESKSGNLLLEKYYGIQNEKAESLIINYSPDDKVIVISYSIGEINIVNAETGELLKRLKGEKVSWASYSSDGRKLIVCYYGDKIKVWNTERLIS